MKVITARQAVFNYHNQVVAYKLSFRAPLDMGAIAISPLQANAKLVVDSQFLLGLRRICSGKKAIIEFTPSAILNEFPNLLPEHDLIVAISATANINEEEFAAIKRLFHQNYKLAVINPPLSLFTQPTNEQSPWHDLLRLFRLGVVETNKYTQMELAEVTRHLKQYKELKLLAANVPDDRTLSQAKQLPFVYFSGQFFAKPQLVRQNDIEISSGVVLKLFQQLAFEHLNYTKIAEYLQQDAGISYRLLRFINSGLFPTKEEISSIRQGLVYLGDKQARMFLNLIVTAHVARNKPHELMRVCTIRAKFCQVVAKRVAPGASEQAFIVGLFSLLDAILDKPMETVLKTLPISEEIRNALLDYDNILKRILDLVKAYEDGRWHHMEKAANVLRLEEAELPGFYVEAIKWAEALCNYHPSNLD